MLRLQLAHLLDDPELDIFTFFPEYGTKQMPYSFEYHFTIYVVREGEEVFYVGKWEDDCFARLRTHLGHEIRGRRSKSSLGEFVLRDLPESREWYVELYTNEETKKLVEKRFYEGFHSWPTQYAEMAMIKTLRPYLNISLNSQNWREIPKRYRQ
jgi:hypothetical protein